MNKKLLLTLTMMLWVVGIFAWLDLEFHTPLTGLLKNIAIVMAFIGLILSAIVQVKCGIAIRNAVEKILRKIL